MSAQLLNTVLLPVSLGLMMLALGLSLQVKHFANVIQHPKAIALGLLMQLFLLPATAWLVIAGLSVPAELAAGLILIALAPGGATSNAISFLSRGDTALSISLTAVTSLITPFSIPLLLSLQYQWLGLETTAFDLPILPTMFKLIVVTLLPVLIGMTLRHLFERTVSAIQAPAQRLVGILFVALVIAMAWVNRAQLPDIISISTAAILCLCCLAMLFSNRLATAAGLHSDQQITLTIEVGIQNAGTAMMVAATLMQQPALAMIALYYGIAMNAPALAIIGARQFRTDTSHSYAKT